MNHPKIFIIHDARQQWRYETFTRELAQQGITEYDVFPSVYDPRSSMRGINLAHKQCVEYGKLLGEKEICIMEDDVQFCGRGAFKYFLSKHPGGDFDLFLAGIYIGDIGQDSTVKSFSGFHCYIIHQRFYDVFLGLPADQHIDRACAGLGKFVVCHPFAAIQYNGFSGNTGKVEDYSKLLEGRQFYNSEN